MKKTILFLTILLIITGCGKKESKVVELNCTKTISDKNSSVVYENKYTYEEKKLTTVSTNATLTFTEEGIANLETFKTYAQASKDEYNKKDGVKAILTTNDNSISIDVNYDVAAMSESEIENSGYNKDLDELKEFLDSEGYSCK